MGTKNRINLLLLYNINNIIFYPFAITAAALEFIMRSWLSFVTIYIFRNLGEPRRVFRSACGRRISN